MAEMTEFQLTDEERADGQYIVEKILDCRPRDHPNEYFIKWQGYTTEESSWTSIVTPDLVKEYLRRWRPGVEETTYTSSGVVRSLPCWQAAIVKKNANPSNKGLLFSRGGFRDGVVVDGVMQKQQLVSGGRDHCLSDACAMLLDSCHKVARCFFGTDRSFDRAREYVIFCNSEFRLDDVSTKMTNTPGGAAFALINSSGRYVLQFIYTADDEKSTPDNPRLYHCAMYDGDLAPTEGEKTYRGVLKDNQSDVGVHFAEDSDRATKEAARAFFAEPYGNRMCIARVYELVTKEEVFKRESVRVSKRAAVDSSSSSERASKRAK
jgi:hypothetical protein